MAAEDRSGRQPGKDPNSIKRRNPHDRVGGVVACRARCGERSAQQTHGEEGAPSDQRRSSLEIVSPPARVMSLMRMGFLMVALIDETLPSHLAKLTTPLCLLDQ